MTKEEAIECLKLLRIMDAPKLEEAVDMAIKALKQPEPQWISCSERLPEFMEPVLTWDGACIAWMPLPTPFLEPTCEQKGED